MSSTAEQGPSGRSSRTSRHHRSGVGECAKLRLATSDELKLLGSLASRVLDESTGAGSHLVQRLHAFPFVNYSPFKVELSVDRIDRGLALSGENWLNAYAFMHALFQHFRTRLPVQLGPLEAKVEKFGRTLFSWRKRQRQWLD